jgi:hypothetical protein
VRAKFELVLVFLRSEGLIEEYHFVNTSVHKIRVIEAKVIYLFVIRSWRQRQMRRRTDSL